MIVDLEAPRFNSGGMFSQNPTLSYIRSEKNLNDDQRRAIHKVLSAKDYTLILGMPGTEMEAHSVNDIKDMMEHIRVIGATCLGINHPLHANKKFDVCIMDEAGQITLPADAGR